MTHLGGHANNLNLVKYTLQLLKAKRSLFHRKSISVANVLSRMGHGISIRAMEICKMGIWKYPTEVIKEFAKYSDIPLINMECDKFHPTQALLTWLLYKKKFGQFKGEKFTMSYAYSASPHKPRAVPILILAPVKMGMDVTFAYPKGFELDPKVIEQCKKMGRRKWHKIQYDQ
jgi:N-acetylornithine carbamoyltransferase